MKHLLLYRKGGWLIFLVALALLAACERSVPTDDSPTSTPAPLVPTQILPTAPPPTPEIIQPTTDPNVPPVTEPTAVPPQPPPAAKPSMWWWQVTHW
ncbi:MAG: hypothetical protein HC804_04995 [Anaerolineae bacterium]|nr:hypothetical protein [Anaerolineae bacterium]